jgi:hypothetical protein
MIDDDLVVNPLTLAEVLVASARDGQVERPPTIGIAFPPTLLRY